ncbi:hypothetical protein GCM10020256_41010 [Streptomyces thermocoprophilus]
MTVTAAPGARTDRVGALFHEGESADSPGGHFCTASVVHSPGHDLVLTAAHCLAGDETLYFAPGYRDGQAPHGLWTVARRHLPEGWADGGQDEDSDLAFAVLEPDEEGQEVEDVVGALRFTPGTATGATAVTVTGYPADRDTPVTCTAHPRPHGPTQQSVTCPAFSAGTSGSPWVSGDGRVVGVIGGYEQGGDTDDVSYSVVLGKEAARLYATATDNDDGTD